VRRNNLSFFQELSGCFLSTLNCNVHHATNVSVFSASSAGINPEQWATAAHGTYSFNIPSPNALVSHRINDFQERAMEL
jgi:hypothetical protein